MHNWRAETSFQKQINSKLLNSRILNSLIKLFINLKVSLSVDSDK